MKRTPHLLRRLLPTALCFAALTTQAQVTYTPVFSNVWMLAAGAHNDMTNQVESSGNTTRGIAINPLTTNVLFTSTYAGTNGSPTHHVAVLSGASGSNYLGQLNSTGFGAGTVAATGIRVSDDGYVYACNVSGSPASTFKIWRWPSDSDLTTAPTIVFNAPNNSSFQWRVGDYIDLRGSGLDTEIVAVGNGANGTANVTTNFVIFRPTDASATAFTNFTITIPFVNAGVPTNLCGAGVAFDGTNNALWIRQAGSQLTRHITYNPTTLTAVVDRTNNVDQSACQGLKYYSTNGVQLLATLQANSTLNAAQIARVFQIPSTPTGPFISVMSSNLTVTTGSRNANALGNVDVRNGFFAFSAPGHGAAFYRVNLLTNSPPSVSAPTGGGTFIEGLATNTFTVTASGTPPLRYQWFFGTNTPVGVNTNFLSQAPVTTADVGNYFVVVTNAFGAATSSIASLSILPLKASNLATQLWTLPPGSRDYVSTDNNQRGMAYDPINSRLVLVSRTPTNGIHLLEADTGTDAGELDASTIFIAPPTATFQLNNCGVAEDGAVYVANLVVGVTEQFAIYRWDGATNTATFSLAYGPTALGLGRLGDTMAVRGAGVNTEILFTFRNGTNAALFTTADGSTFSFNLIAITNFPATITEASLSPAGLGVAWGTGNTFWVKSSTFNLRQIQYDLASNTGGVIKSFDNSIGSEQPIGVDNVNGFVATIGATQSPQTMPIYDLAANDGNSIAALLDREVFPTSNANANATGSIAFDVAGGRIFALDSNNGIIASTYAPRLFITPEIQGGVVTWTGPGTLQGAPAANGPYSDIVTTSPYTNTVSSQVYFRVRR
ncbi:MAG: hypothetical protein U1F65_01115 [Verrucomicrobiota bacterium]